MTPQRALNIIIPIPCALITVILLLLTISTRATATSGSWDPLMSSIGISAMHMQLLHTDRVVIFDRTDFGRSNISLAPGKPCRTNDTVVKPEDCTAHSVEYDVAANAVRPLTVLTNVWCSSGALTPDGDLIQAGGFNSGDHVVRIYRPCDSTSGNSSGGSCGDWREVGRGLAQRRWYATSQILPDGRQVIVGGRRQYNYEFYPKGSPSEGAYTLPFLVETNDPKIENNLYPYVFLNTDGKLFIFANNRAILFDYSGRKVLRTYPAIPGGDPRSYPSSGSAVLLPLLRDDPGSAEVLVCGGAPKGAYVSAMNGNFVRALNTCGRIRINDPVPEWAVESMPTDRVMGDMVLLPNGNVLIINGAGSGTAGWELGRDPVANPVLYRPGNQIGSRFEIQTPSPTPRMYHSTAILLRDGRVLVGGSNPHVNYNFTSALFPTDLSLESFSPSYLDPSFAYLRPKIVSPISQSRINYSQQLAVRFTVPSDRFNASSLTVTMVAPPFTTHSFSMNQRLLVLKSFNVSQVAKSTYDVRVAAPSSGNFAPSGYYMMYVVHVEVPSEGVWVQMK